MSAKPADIILPLVTPVTSLKCRKHSSMVFPTNKNRRNTCQMFLPCIKKNGFITRHHKITNNKTLTFLYSWQNRVAISEICWARGVWRVTRPWGPSRLTVVGLGAVHKLMSLRGKDLITCKWFCSRFTRWTPQCETATSWTSESYKTFFFSVQSVGDRQKGTCAAPDTGNNLEKYNGQVLANSMTFLLMLALCELL